MAIFNFIFSENERAFFVANLWSWLKKMLTMTDKKRKEKNILATQEALCFLIEVFFQSLESKEKLNQLYINFQKPAFGLEKGFLFTSGT